jgi:tryptophan synthase beta chain
MNFNVDDRGFYGEFGGAYIPEMMYSNIEELKDKYLNILEDKEFREDFDLLLRDYAGRPSPLFHAKRLSQYYKTQIFLKRNDHQYAIQTVGRNSKRS